MANKKINQLDSRVLSSTDLMLIGDPTTGISYKSLISGLGLVYVPYTGATANIALGEYGISGGYFQADLTPTMTGGVGRLIWNDTDGTLDLGLKGGNVTLQIGQEQILRVVNKTGANLLESQYRAVRIRLASEGGTQGQRLAVVLAQGNNDANSADTIGIVTENIDNNQEGFICTSGLVRDINTTGSLQGETWADGDIIYLSPTTPGAITKVKPTAPNHSVILGYVVYAHANNGKIFVKCDNGYELGELHDVYVPTPSNNDGIFWNSSTLRYENKTVAGALGYTPISGSGVTGQVAYWNGTNSQTGSNNLFWSNGNTRLGIGTNIPLETLHINTGNVLLINGKYRIYNTGQNNYSDQSYTNNGYLLEIAGTSYLTVFRATGNLLLQNGGTFTDNGQRLQVQGDAFIKGSGATDATIALQVQNSSSTNLLRVRNDSVLFTPHIIYVGQNTTNTLIYAFDGNANTSPSASGRNFGIFNGNTTQTGDQSHFALVGNSLTPTSGDTNGVLFQRTFAPTSGIATFKAFNINPTINQTGGANGITRGLYVNPTLTAAADWRSIEWSNNSGWGLYGAGTANNFINGSVGVGTTTMTYKFNVTDTSATYVAGFRGASSTYIVVGDTSLAGEQGVNLRNSSGQAFIALGGTVLGISATSGANTITLSTGGTEKMRLTNAGRLLLGTTTESTFLLDVNGTARVSGATYLATSSGSVGIGTTSPNVPLEINGQIRTARINNSLQYLQLEGGDAVGAFITAVGVGKVLTIRNNNTISSDIIFDQAVASSYLFQQATVTKMTLTSGGNLLVGTTTDNGARFQVSGAATFSSSVTAGLTSAIGTQLTLNAAYSNGITFINTNNAVDNRNFRIISDISTYGDFQIQKSTTVGGSTYTNLLTFAMSNEATFSSSVIATSFIPNNSSIPTNGMYLPSANTLAFATNSAGNRIRITSTGSILVGTSTDVSSSIFTIVSTTKGFLPPKMTTTEKNAISSPAAGLQVYDTTLNQMSYYNGTTWVNF